MVDFKRKVETVYVLEPWYSKMRYELKTMGWVQDNVLYARAQNTLESALSVVIPKLAIGMLQRIWLTWFAWLKKKDWPKSGGALMVWVLYVFWGIRINPDMSITFSPRYAPGSRLKNVWPKEYHLTFATIPLHHIVDKLGIELDEHNVLQKTDGARLVDALRPIFDMEFKQEHSMIKFPYNGSMVQKVGIKKVQYERGTAVFRYSDENVGDDRFAKALDRMRDSIQGMIPDRILALNVGLNTWHNSFTAGILLPGVKKSDLDRWSRMGVQPKATAKRFLDTKINTIAYRNVLVESMIEDDFLLAEALDLLMEYEFGEKIQSVLDKIRNELSKLRHEREILADEMGLGKTLTVLLAARALFIMVI